MPGISINTTAKIITPAKFQKRCESLLKQKFVRFTEDEKQEIVKISKNPDISGGFESLSLFLKEKFNTIAGRDGKLLYNGNERKLPGGKLILGIYPRLNTERKKLLIKPERVADIFDKITKYNEKAYKYFNNLVYQSSSNADILTIEQNLRKKGVKAKFSKNSSLDFAKLTEEALEDIEKKGYELPKRISISNLLRASSAGFVNMGPTKPAETIFINSQNACETLNSIKNKRTLDCLSHFKSTDNPKHGIYHESAHWLHSRMGLKELFVKYFSALSDIPGNKPVLSSNNIELLKNSVSEYAASNEKGLDAVAEIFAGLMDGKTYPPEVMEIYHRLKGPVPKAK